MMNNFFCKFIEWIAFLVSPLFRLFVNASFPKSIQRRCLDIFFYLISFKPTDSKYYNFSSIQSFFTRAPSENQSFKGEISSPVEGFLYACDYVKNASLFHIKGLPYSLYELIPFDYANLMKDALFHSIYLSPQDCHRVFVPLNADLISIDYIGGDCRPVRDLWMRNYPNLFCRNERCVFRFQNDDWDVVLVMIAALNVGGIQIDILPNLGPFIGKKHSSQRFFEGKMACGQGSRLATFLLGSSIVLMTSPRKKYSELKLKKSQKIMIGNSLI